MEHQGFEEIDPNELKIDPVNERVSNVNPHSEEGESLQESIQQQGVLEPVVVRKKDGDFLVIAGQRRTLAAQAAGVDQIPVRIMEMDDSEARLASITENAEQYKKEVPKGDRAQSVKELVDSGLSPSTIADRMGATEPTIRRWLEPALEYWENTDFAATSNGDSDDDLGPDDISLEAMRVIRKNTSDKKQRERVAKKVVEKNVKNKLVKAASKRSNNSDNFEDKLDKIIRSLESNESTVRKETYFTKDYATKLENIAKSRGINEKQVIEELAKERMDNIKYMKDGKLLQIKISEGTEQGLRDAIGDRDLPMDAVGRAIIKKRLKHTGYLQSTQNA